MKITIAGGGIGGLATALALHGKQLVPSLSINILERDPRPTTIVDRGAGMNLQPNAVKALDEMGLMEEVVASGWAPRKQQYFTKSGHSIAESPRGLDADSSGYPQISIHRANLHKILEGAVQERLGHQALRRGIQAVSYSQNKNGVFLRCESTRKNKERSDVMIHSDVLIGADGIHSSVRKIMLRNAGKEEVGPIKSGINIYRGTTWSNKVLDGQTIVLAGHSKAKLVCYPLGSPKSVILLDGSIGQEQLLNFVVELADDPESPSEMHDLSDYVASKLEELNSGFQLDFLDHRSLLKNANSIRAFPMADRDPLETWCDSRVALMGDAAHPMYPVGSNGASLAILDASEIASSFHETFKEKTERISHLDICQSLENYQKMRLPVASSVQLACRKLLPEQVMDQVHEESLTKGPAPVSSRHSEKLLQALGYCQIGHIGDDRKRDNTALKSLRTPIAFANEKQARNFSPIERVILTANGTLQRIISAVANTEVIVKPVMTSARDSAFLDREVTLHLGSPKGPCVAKCTTTALPHDADVKEKLLSHKVGIAQLLTEIREEGKGVANFQLLAAGKKKNENVLTRQYKLDVRGQVTFLIHEEIHMNMLLQHAAMTLGTACTPDHAANRTFASVH